jgi:hypothetical protein
MIFTDVLTDVLLNPPVRDVRNQLAFYPSSASCVVLDPVTGLKKVVGGPSSCLRHQYYAINKYAYTNRGSAQNELKKEMGGHIQEMVEDKLKQAGVWFGSEKRIWIPHIGLSGRLDAWCWDPESLRDGRSRIPVPIEFKSISGYQEGGVVKVSKHKLMPKDEHIAQVLPYLDFFSQWPEFFHGEPVKIVLFVISRESMTWKEHIVMLGGDGHYGMPFAEDERYAIVRNEIGTFQLQYLSIRGVYNRWAQLRQYLRKKEIPPRDFEKDYSNEKLALLAEKEVLNKTKRGKLATARKNDPDGKGPWMPGEGDWQCAYCEYKDLCWTGIKHQHPPVLRQENPQMAEVKAPPVTEPTGTI